MYNQKILYTFVRIVKSNTINGIKKHDLNTATVYFEGYHSFSDFLQNKIFSNPIQ